MVGIFANNLMAGEHEGLISGGGLHLLWVQAYTGAWVIAFSAIGTFILLKLVGLVVPLRMSEADMETGDIAVHGHEVYPSDVPSLGYPSGTPGAARGRPRPLAPRHKRGAGVASRTEPPPTIPPGGGSGRGRCCDHRRRLRIPRAAGGS